MHGVRTLHFESTYHLRRRAVAFETRINHEAGEWSTLFGMDIPRSTDRMDRCRHHDETADHGQLNEAYLPDLSAFLHSCRPSYPIADLLLEPR